MLSMFVKPSDELEKLVLKYQKEANIPHVDIAEESSEKHIPKV